MNASLEQHIIDLTHAILAGGHPELTTVLENPEIFGWRLLCWIPDSPLTAEQQQSLAALQHQYMKPAGIASASFNAEGTALNILVCLTTFPARVHRDTALWLCAQGLLEHCSNDLNQAALSISPMNSKTPPNGSLSAPPRAISPTGGA